MCDDMPAIVSPSSEGIMTVPGSCLLVTDTGNAGPGTLRHCIHCAQDGDEITYDDSGVSQSFLNEPLVVDKSVSIKGQLESGLPQIQLDYNSISGPGIIISGNQVLLENLEINTINNISNEILIRVNSGSILTTGGSVGLED
jgi:hypothetical protein